MIRVAPAPEPGPFDATVRKPGLRAIAEMVGKKPVPKRTAGQAFKKRAGREEDLRAEDFPPSWAEALPDLMRAYHGVCAYSCFRIHPVTGAASADHFAPKSRHWKKVYEWDNYRLACSRLNARKNDYGDVLDPFLIQDGWFQLELVGFQVIPDPKLPKTARGEVQRTIDRLGLNDFRDDREEDAVAYWAGDISLKTLKRESPFVAAELHRQGRLNSGDVW